MRWMAAALLAFFVIFQVSDAQAAKWRFGTEDRLETVSTVAAKGPNGEELVLARKITTEFFILPYSVTDNGYVLKVVGNDYYQALDAATTAKLQARGLLPTPLPPYAMTTLDLIMGHLLWVTIGALVLWFAISAWWTNRRKKSGETGA